MFGRKKHAASARAPHLCLMDQNKRELYNAPLDAFPFPETVIIAASQEFFNDPEPCEIHRRAVQLRLCAEIQQVLPANLDLPADDVPALILMYCQEYHPAYIRLDTQGGAQ